MKQHNQSSLVKEIIKGVINAIQQFVQLSFRVLYLCFRTLCSWLHGFDEHTFPYVRLSEPEAVLVLSLVGFIIFIEIILLLQ